MYASLSLSLYIYIYIIQAGTTEAKDPITPYIDINKLKLKIKDGKDPMIVIQKRVHSRAWHDEHDRLKAQEYSESEISIRARIYANMHVSRWKRKVGIEE